MVSHNWGNCGRSVSRNGSWSVSRNGSWRVSRNGSWSISDCGGGSPSSCQSTRILANVSLLRLTAGIIPKPRALVVGLDAVLHPFTIWLPLGPWEVGQIIIKYSNKALSGTVKTNKANGTVKTIAGLIFIIFDSDPCPRF